MVGYHPHYLVSSDHLLHSLPWEHLDSLNCPVLKQLFMCQAPLTHIIPLYSYRSLLGQCQFYLKVRILSLKNKHAPGKWQNQDLCRCYDSKPGCGIYFLHNLTLLKAYPLEFKNNISWNLLHDTYLFVLQLAKIKVGLIC